MTRWPDATQVQWRIQDLLREGTKWKISPSP